METANELITEFIERIDLSVRAFEFARAEARDRRELADSVNQINTLKALKQMLSNFGVDKDF